MSNQKTFSDEYLIVLHLALLDLAEYLADGDKDKTQEVMKLAVDNALKRVTNPETLTSPDLIESMKKHQKDILFQLGLKGKTA